MVQPNLLAKISHVTSLCAGHQVPLGLHYRNGIFLHRSWSGVAGQSNVAHDNLPHVHILELLNRKWELNINIDVQSSYLMFYRLSQSKPYTLDVGRAVLSCCFNGNVVVFLKVDPGVAA